MILLVQSITMGFWHFLLASLEEDTNNLENKKEWISGELLSFSSGLVFCGVAERTSGEIRTK